MAGNSAEQIRRKLYEEYEDSLFRLVMHDTAEIEGKLLLTEKEKLKNDQETVPTEKTVQRFSRQLNTNLKKNRTVAARRSFLKMLNRSAVAMLAVIVILGTTVASVEALRVRVLNLWMDIKPEYTSFQLKENGSNPDKGRPGSSTDPHVGWAKAYVPTYIPEGFTVSDSSNHEEYKKILYKNQQGKVIIYTEHGEGTNFAVDTENADVVKTVGINGHKGTLVEKNSTVTIVWAMDNRMFVIQALTDEETAMKIAEGVEYVE
ncbi:MAG: hypothetical protein APF84_12785 [Gracilibacter sp. BRH_c7a]|nr:MAG: hypothetical protein APF84_12785 [Gracilibacter sp. BRH_c7a]